MTLRRLFPPMLRLVALFCGVLHLSEQGVGVEWVAPPMCGGVGVWLRILGTAHVLPFYVVIITVAHESVGVCSTKHG